MPDAAPVTNATLSLSIETSILESADHCADLARGSHDLPQAGSLSQTPKC
jgi:hypothetical protein